MEEEIVIIRKVAEPHGWMGNMAAFPVTDTDGKLWITTEHLFQAMRFPLGHQSRIDIWREKSPMAAKMKAKHYVADMIVEPRSETDVGNMLSVLWMKINQHPHLKKMLLDTQGMRIIEDCSNRRNDSGLFWGAALIDGEWVGRNMLGVLWMGIRSELKNVKIPETQIEERIF